MVHRVVEYDLPDGGTILVEVKADDPVEELVPATSASELVAKAEQTFDQALTAIDSIARGVISRVRHLGDPPDQVEVGFGLKLTGGTSVMLASGSVEANLNVTLSWKREVRPGGP